MNLTDRRAQQILRPYGSRRLERESPQPHWFRAGRKTEDYGYALAPLCRHCGNTLSHPLHTWTKELDR